MTTHHVEIRKELALSLNEWGIRQSENHNHAEFHDQAMQSALVNSTTESTNVPLLKRLEELKKTRLPLDRNEAVRYVLECELNDSRTKKNKEFYAAVDILGLDFQPYFQRTDKHTQRITYKLRKDFDRIPPESRDPLKRFRKISFTTSEWFNYIWKEQKHSLSGTVFEAVVAHYLELKMQCLHCKYRESLRWNGGWDLASSWADMVCIRCRSTYEIKSKATIEKIEKDLHYNKIRGGSFTTFYRYPPLCKRFLVMVSRAESYNKESKSMTHRVSAVEIDHILPRLSAKSFIDTGGPDHRISISSEIVVNKLTLKKAWCHVPMYGEDFRTMARQVYISRFGETGWGRRTMVDDQTLQPDPSKPVIRRPSSPIISAKEMQEKDEKAGMEKLKLSLDAMKFSNGLTEEEDDWETAYASD